MKGLNSGEREHFDWLRRLPCALCEKDGPSFAHHIRDSGNRVGHYITIPLCYDCHQGPSGIHGDKSLWRLYKQTELQLLNKTIEGMRRETPTLRR